MEAGWQDLDFEDEALVCLSVGWLLQDGEESKTVVQNLSGNGHGNGAMVIPTRSILRIVDLPQDGLTSSSAAAVLRCCSSA